MKLINSDNSHAPFFSSTAVGGKKYKRHGKTKKYKKNNKLKKTKKYGKTRKCRKTKKHGKNKKQRGGLNPTYASYSTGGELSRSESALANPSPINKLTFMYK